MTQSAATRRRAGFSSLAGLATIMACAGPAAARADAAAQAPPTSVGEPIVIIGPLPRDPRLDGVEMLDRLGPRDLAGYGVNSVAELLEELSAYYVLGEDLSPLVLVNGRRIASVGEVGDLPTESISRIEILPAPVALRFGGNSGQKVINLILRSRLHAGTANLAGGLATDGGGRSGDSSLAYNRIVGDDRISVGARAHVADRLLESQRDIELREGGVADERHFRTLRPEQRRYSLTGLIQRPVREGIIVSANAGATYETSRSLLGLADDRTDPLRQNTRTAGAYAGARANADIGPWDLSLSAEYGRRATRTHTDIELDSALIQDRARARSDTGALVLIGSGPLFTLPAGEIRVSLRGDVSRSTLDARVDRSGPIANGHRNRTDAGAWADVEVPLLSKGESAGAPGDLSANFRAGLRSVSDIATLRSLGAGLNWTPRSGVNVTASYKDDRQPPSLLQLASPAIETSGLRYFDYLSGRTVEPVQVSGGNPDLDAERRRTLSVGMNVLPLGNGKLRLAADYKRIRAHDPVASLPAATAAIQSGFPDRFLRDPAGNPVRVDNRPVNFDSEARDQFHWGVTFRRSPGGSESSGEDGDSGTGLRLSLQHTIVLKDDIEIGRGVPTLDLLHGGPAGAFGGQPRHLVQWEVGGTSRGLGARLLGSWRSGTTVRGGDGSASGTLHFSPLMQHDLRLFADLGERLPGLGWTRDTRLSLTVGNILNRRPRVRDANGITPFSYQPDYLDPVGRTFTVGLRKLVF